MIRDRPRHHRLDPRDEFRLAEPSVGKGRVVGDIDDVDVRPQPPDLAEHGQAAEPRVEHERARRAANIFPRHGNPIAPQVRERRVERLTTNRPARQRRGFHAQPPVVVICKTLRRRAGARSERRTAPPDICISFHFLFRNEPFQRLAMDFLARPSPLPPAPLARAAAGHESTLAAACSPSRGNPDAHSAASASFAAKSGQREHNTNTRNRKETGNQWDRFGASNTRPPVQPSWWIELTLGACLNPVAEGPESTLGLNRSRGRGDERGERPAR